jgi:hypothetical protein
VACGTTAACRRRSRDGRLIARAGALGFLLRNPEDRTAGLKIRNLGSADELAAAGMNRYVYRIAGHGAPAWCSPSYGKGSALLITEGELNGAAASRALLASGLSLDVQGLAGAGGVPHLEAMAGKVVYLYADPDPAGAACVERLGRIAQAVGAAEVQVLPASTDGDFCDLLGQLGPVAFGHRLQASLEAAQVRAFDLGPRSDFGPTPVPETMLSGTVPSIWGQHNKPGRGIWSSKRGLL